ncbi:MAG: sigma-70 family RNA polymerase sigma factor [Pirellulaceae bacterium]
MRTYNAATSSLRDNLEMRDRPTTSLSLLVRARSGEDAAWGRIVEIYGPIVFEQCRRRGFREEDARDLTQDIFLAVSQSLDSFRREKPGDSFLHWLRSIVSRKVVDFIRKEAGKVQATGGDTAHLLIEQIPERSDLQWEPDSLRRHAFERAVQLMKTDFQENTWRAFWLSVVEGKSTDEVCSTLGMKAGAVRNARSKVQKRLIEELGDLLDVESH